MTLRLYDELICHHFRSYRQMLFLSGPRQVGKTTCGLRLQENADGFAYLNWDCPPHRKLIEEGPDAVAAEFGFRELAANHGILVFETVHKLPMWKGFLKGFFDIFGQQLKILVTGSAKLSAFRSDGDSLMGRYFSYTMHPLSLGELLSPSLQEGILRVPIPSDPDLLERLLRFGGFPEPFNMGQDSFSRVWQQRRLDQLFQEDLPKKSQLLAELLRLQVGQLTSLTSLAKKVGVTINTIKRWIAILENLFYCYRVPPYSSNMSRSSLQKPKYFLWDWSAVSDAGARAENFVASHLLKAVHLWTDSGMGEHKLHFVRDKEKREVDFLVTRKDRPWLLVEVKSNRSDGPSSALEYFWRQTGADHALQVVLNMDFVDRSCFEFETPMVVPARTFLSQLP